VLFGQVAIVAIMGCRRPVSLWRLQVEPRLVAPPPPPSPVSTPGKRRAGLSSTVYRHSNAFADRSSKHRPRAAEPTTREAGQGHADAAEDSARTRVRRGADAKSGNWASTDARGAAKEGEDYLYELGRSDVSMNVDTGGIAFVLPHTVP